MATDSERNPETELVDLHPDKARLDWLDKNCDIGRIDLDPDLEGTPRLLFGPYVGDGRRKVRDAIDAAIRDSIEADAAMRADKGEVDK